MQVNDSPFPELLPSLFCRLRQRGRGKCEGTSRSARGLASPLTVHPRMMPSGIGRGMPGGKVVSATRTFGMRTARRILGCTQKDEVKQYKRMPIYKVSMEEASCGAVSPGNEAPVLTLRLKTCSLFTLFTNEETRRVKKEGYHHDENKRAEFCSVDS